MRSPNYDLDSIQSDAFELITEARKLGWHIFGLTDEVTPRTVIENFTELDRVYQSLKSQIDAVQKSLNSGHDPDRHLFTYEKEENNA
jgi:hypothetical protein